MKKGGNITNFILKNYCVHMESSLARIHAYFMFPKRLQWLHELNKRTEKCFVNLNEFLSILKFFILAKYCSWFRNESGTKPLLFLGNVNQESGF